jgi:exo-beta-1,3-glucanase (GH17 family)
VSTLTAISFGDQFGFDGTDEWISRRDNLFSTLHSNPRAKFVTRVVQFGSEPLFDNVLTPGELTTQVMEAKEKLSSLGIPVTVSELAYGYQERGGAQDVLNAIDSINIHMLPFFAQSATTGKSPSKQPKQPSLNPASLPPYRWYGLASGS